jgi:hypothetical protein
MELMSEAIGKNTPPATPLPFALEVIDLDAHPDGTLLRLIAEGTKAREAYYLLTQRRYRKGMAKADRAEGSAAFRTVMLTEARIIGTGARTGFGLLAKTMFALEHRDATEPHRANLTWGIGGLLFSVVNDSVRMGAFS